MEEREIVEQVAFGDDSTVGRFITRKGTYDRGIIEETWVGKFYTKKEGFEIAPGDNVIDIGAHIGAFSVYAAKRGARVSAFEPEKENFAMLLEQREHNPEILNTLAVYPCAVTGDGRSVTMVKCAVPENTGGGWTSRKPKEGEGVPVNGDIVESMTLEQIISEEVDFLKMDCEGAEYEILMQSSDETIAKIQKISMEWHSGKQAFLELKAFLQERGFECEFGGSDDMGWAYFWRK